MALWRICTALGFPHPRLMLAAMTSRELTELLSFHAIEPLGEERADLRSAIVASTLANVNRDSKRHPQPYRPKDFMPYHHEPEEDADALWGRIESSFNQMKARKHG